LKTALEDHPNEPLLWYEIGRIHTEQKQFAEAVMEFTRATKLDPEFAEAYNQLGIVLAESGQLTEAEATFRSALRIDPYDANASRNLQALNAFRRKVK